jgi:hypothetical protein
VAVGEVFEAQTLANCICFPMMFLWIIYGGRLMAKKAINLVLEDQDIIELMRIVMDEDAEGALSFLRDHFKGKARDLLEGG